MSAAEYVRLLTVAHEALTAARLYSEKDSTLSAWRPPFADLWMLDTITAQVPNEGPEGGDDWWPIGGATEAMAAVVESGQRIELLPGDAYEYVDEDIAKALLAVGRYASIDDEVCGGCGKRWPEGTGEVIECENEGCPGTCPACQNDPCPHHEGSQS